MTQVQSPALPRNSNGRLDFAGPTQEEACIPRCNSRIPWQLEKNNVVPLSSKYEAPVSYSVSREVQSSIRVARESWGLHLSQCRTKKTSFRLVSRTEFSSTGATQISGSHSRLTQVVRPRLEGKQWTLLSSRVATCISWSPLCVLKGVKPPVEFGERTRFSTHSGLQEIPIATRDESGILCLPSR